MKNRSKILSPRVTQIRRELSNSAEYAATGFSGICSSAKSQFKKVMSKISGACSTALNLFFQNPEISYQPREVYSFHMKLDSISNTIKSPLPGPKPFHSDSYTMPPTPGRFLTAEEEQNNKKEKSFNPEPRVEVIKKPEYGVPVWKQFGSTCKDKTEISSNEKNKNKELEDSEESKKTVVPYKSFAARVIEAVGSAGQKKVRENPNSTPIRSFRNDARGGVRSAGSEPSVKTPSFGETNSAAAFSEGKDLYSRLGMEMNVEDSIEKLKRHQMQSMLNKENKVDSEKRFVRAKDSDTFSFMDKSEKRDSQGFEEFESANKGSPGLKGNGIGEAGIKDDDKDKDKDKVEGETGVQRKEEVRDKVGNASNVVMSFFVPDAQKKVVEMEEGFINSKSTSKTSSPSKLSESDKEKNENDSKKCDKNTESIKPDQKLTNISSKNPFLTESNPKVPEKQAYVFGSSSNPFVTRPNTSTSTLNPFVSKSDLSPSEFNSTQINPKPSSLVTPNETNPFKSEAKPYSTSNSDGKLNPFSGSNPRYTTNPFAQTNPFTGHSSAPSSETKLQITYNPTPFIPGSNPFSSSQASTTNPFSNTSASNPSNPSHPAMTANKNPFSSSSSAISNPYDPKLQITSSTNPTQQLSSSDVSLKQVQGIKNNENIENPFRTDQSLMNKSTAGLVNKNESSRNNDKEKLVNPFVLPNTTNNNKGGDETKAFTIGILPKREIMGGSRNFK